MVEKKTFRKAHRPYPTAQKQLEEEKFDGKMGVVFSQFPNKRSERAASCSYSEKESGQQGKNVKMKQERERKSENFLSAFFGRATD